MERSGAQTLKTTLTELLSPIVRLRVLTDIHDDVQMTEIHRRYNDSEKVVQALWDRGFIYKSGSKYHLTEIGEQFVRRLSALEQAAESKQKLDPLFKADPVWPTVLPPTSVLRKARITAAVAYSSETEMEYVDFLEGSSSIRILNPLPDHHKALIEALSGSDNAFLQNIDSATVEIRVAKEYPYFDEIKNITSASEIDPDSFQLKTVDSEFPYVLTLTDSRVGVWLHQSLGANRSVFIHDDNEELRDWAEKIYKSAKTES